MKVIAAVDAFAASEDVLSEIVTRTWPEGTRFEVVTVADTGHLSTGEAVADELQATAREVAQRAADRLAGAGLHATACPQWGDPKTAILDYAADGAADWIVIGAHTSLIDGFLLGSVAKALIRHAPCPVEIVRPSEWRKDRDAESVYCLPPMDRKPPNWRRVRWRRVLDRRHAGARDECRGTFDFHVAGI